MAVKTFTQTVLSNNAILYTWSTVTNGDTGEPIKLVNANKIGLTVVGTFGSGGTAKWQVSHDESNWFDLHSDTAAAFNSTDHPALYLRPNTSAGDTTTDLDYRAHAVFDKA